MDAAAELGRNPVSKHQIHPEYGDEQAEAGRDCRTRLARPNSQARTRTGNIHFPVQLTTCRIGNFTRLIHTLAICVSIHTVSSALNDGLVLLTSCVSGLCISRLGLQGTKVKEDTRISNTALLHSLGSTFKPLLLS